MSISIRQSLAKYQGSGYGKINRTLRQNNVTDDIISKYREDKIIYHIKNIDEAIKSAGNPGRKIQLFRGVDIPFHTMDTFIEKGFSSCTTDIDTAVKFTKNGCCILTFFTEPSIDGYAFTYAGGHTESEILLKRNIEYFNIRQIDNTHNNGVRLFFCSIRNYKPPTQTQQAKSEKEMAEMRKKLMEEMDDEDFTMDSDD